MQIALAFDINGTLIDPHGLITELQKHVGDGAGEFSRVWRDKQLEYSWQVSSNPFDVIGAVSADINAAWLQRVASAIFDPWEILPTAVIGGLDELPAVLNVSP